MQRIKSDEKGSALVLSLLLVVVCIVMTGGILAYTSSQNRNSAFNINRISAQYIAEAGAKAAITNVINSLQGMSYSPNNENIGQLSNNLPRFNLPNGSYTVSYRPNSTDPKKITRIEITSVGTSNGVKHTSRVLVALENDPLARKIGGVVDLFENCNYSHNPPSSTAEKDELPWKITPASDGNRASATSPKEKGNFQVKFNDCFTENNMKISYNGACKNFPGYNDPSGYGIYYGMTGTADNPDAYVLQYDPGAGTNGSFFVKRVVARSSTPSYAYDNEFNCQTGRYYNQSYGHYEQRWNSRTNSFEDVWVKGGTNCYVPFWPTEKYTADPNDGNNVTWVSLEGPGPNSLKNIMTNAGKTFDVRAEHKITIEVTTDGVHQIYCDGVLILHFKDESKYKKDIYKTSTGLRTWNADIGFYNDPDDETPRVKLSSIIWVK